MNKYYKETPNLSGGEDDYHCLAKHPWIWRHDTTNDIVHRWVIDNSDVRQDGEEWKEVSSIMSRFKCFLQSREYNETFFTEMSEDELFLEIM